MATQTIRITGLRELKAKLDRMPEAMARKIVAASLRAGARVVLQAAKRNARRQGGSGTLSRAVVLARDRNASKLNPMYAIYTRRGKSYQIGMTAGRRGSKRKANKSNMDGYYGPWVELGTKPHDIRGLGGKPLSFRSGGARVAFRQVRHPGAKATPYLGTAFDNNTTQAMAEIRRYAAARIEKEMENA